LGCRCKRFRELAQSKVVLTKASPRCLAVRAKSWSDAAHRFLQRCADAGNLDASYLLGMVRAKRTIPETNPVCFPPFLF
jgi:hypothetical protein